MCNSDCKQQACDCSSGTCVCTGAKILAEVQGAVIVQTTAGANNVVTCLDSTSSSARAPPVGSAAKSQYDFPFPGSSAKSRFGTAFAGGLPTYTGSLELDDLSQGMFQAT